MMAPPGRDEEARTHVRRISFSITIGLLWAVTHVDVIAAEPRPIFDGTSLAGWEGDQAWWRAEDGAITGEIPAGTKLKTNQFLWWEGTVADFDLALEYRITGDASANSGIQYRSERLPDGHAKGYQADLDDGATWAGRIYDEHGRGLLVERGARLAIAPDGRTWGDPFAPPDAIRGVVKPGDWNRYRIRATASHVTIWINDELAAVLDDRDAKQAEFAGRLALQLHSGPGPAKVQFRNIRLTDLGETTPVAGPAMPPAADAAAIAATTAAGTPLDLGFESGTLAGWTAAGDAFTGLPVPADAVAKRKRRDASNAAGRHWAGTYEPRHSDETRGTLTSEPFPITHRWASFLAGGGGHAETRVELVDDESGEVFHQARGRAVERMHRELVDLEKRQGRRMRIRLVDEHVGPWGHINFDDFVFHASRPAFGDPGSAGRDRTSPVLWHTVANHPAAPPPTPAARGHQALATVAGMMVTPGFRCDLVASEPAIHQPIAFAIDPRGRLWVAEAHSYPNKRPEGEGHDRIVILADGDGDGGYETRTVFCEGLNLVSGLELGFGGVWIGAAPHLLFIPDRDGDDVPDGEPQVLLDGWGFQDTHETLNSFTWGPDGWLYGNHGVFTTSEVGPPGTAPADRVRINAAVWRYHPVRRTFEVFAHGGSNQWGIDFNSIGDAFMAHCRSFFGGGGTSHVIRNGHFWNQVNNGHAAFICREPPPFAPGLRNYLPAAARYDSGEGGAGKKGTDAVYGGHSHVGTLVYLGDNWPAIYRDRILTHNLHGRQLNHQEAVRRGSGYEVFHAGYDILHVPDEQYVAVDLQTGPDGAVYVIDWCDRQHCHTNVADRWDRSNGRLYRVAWAETYRPVLVNLASKTDAELVALHTHPNEWFVRTARRLLQERAAADRLDRTALAPLQQAAASEDPLTALRAIWTLHVTGRLDDERIAAAFTHPSDQVRGQAVALATEIPGSPRIPADRLVASAAADPSAVVRRSLASALPALSPPDRWRLAEALAAHAEDATDRFLPKLAWTGLAPLVEGDPARALELAATTPLPALADSIRWYLGRTPEGRSRLTAEIAAASPAVAERTLRLLDFTVAAFGTVAPPAGWGAAAERFGGGEAADAVQRLAAAFGDATVLARMRSVLADGKAEAKDRRRAFELLARSGDPEALPLFVTLLGDQAFRGDVIPLVSQSNDPAVATTLLASLPELDARQRAAALSTLVAKGVFAGPLLDAIAAGNVPRDSLTAAQIRQLRGIRDPAIAARVDATWGRLNESPAAARAAMARLKKTWAEAPQWAVDHKRHGLAVFNRVCANCHTHGDVGGKLGPNLTGSWMNGPDYFIENLVDPNAVVGPDYQLTVVITDDGRSINGIVAEETAAAVVLKTPDGPVTVPKDSIDERTTSPVSMMPSGLLENLPDADLLALIKFLTTKP
jgi:putative membrane-bound dehydrogenase-like protein